MFIPIGGIEQWVQIGTENRVNPVLLYLHGGPGGTSRPVAGAWKPWERHFTIVHWDQRGAGRTFEKNGEAGSGRLTIDRMVQDGIEVVEFLRAHLGQDKIILVGHSWGSILGIHMIKTRPELFTAYVGTGQVVNMRRNEEFNYARQLAQARDAGNQEALAALDEIGPPPYSDLAKIRILRDWSDRLARGADDAVQPQPHVRPSPSDFSATDVKPMMEGFAFSGRQLFDELCTVDLPSLGLDFPIPIFFFEGTEDQQTPMALAEEYLTAISAPHKELVRFEGCHHFVVMNRADDFLNELVTRVLPVVGPSYPRR